MSRRSSRVRSRAFGGAVAAALVVLSLVLAPAAGATRPGELELTMLLQFS